MPNLSLLPRTSLNETDSLQLGFSIVEEDLTVIASEGDCCFTIGHYTLDADLSADSLRNPQ